MTVLQLAIPKKLIKASKEKMTTSFSIPAGIILFEVRDLKNKEMLAVTSILPRPSQMRDFAMAIGRHLEVVARGVKIFDTKWYLQNMEVTT